MERPSPVPNLSCSLSMEKDSPLPPRQPKTTVLPHPEKSRVSLSLDKAIEFELIHGRHLDPGLDGKMIRRTISNRLSAQRSRIKKSHYLADMEKKAQHLEKLVSSLTPRVEVYKEKKRMLQLENDSLRAQVHIREAQSKISQDGVEQRRREITELKEILRQKGVEIQVSGPEEEIMQVSGPQEHTMQASGPEEEIMGQVELQVGPKPYSIEFYEQRLMQMDMIQFIDHELTAAPVGPPESEVDSMIEISFNGEKEEEEVEVDQYLNLDHV